MKPIKSEVWDYESWVRSPVSRAWKRADGRCYVHDFISFELQRRLGEWRECAVVDIVSVMVDSFINYGLYNLGPVAENSEDDLLQR